MSPDDWLDMAMGAKRVTQQRQRAERAAEEAQRAARLRAMISAEMEEAAPYGIQQYAMRDLDEANIAARAEANRLAKAEARMARENATGVGGAFLNYLREQAAPRAAGALASAAVMLNPLDMLNIADVVSPNEEPEPFPLSTEDILKRWDPEILRSDEAIDARLMGDEAMQILMAPAMAKGAIRGLKKLAGPAPLRNIVSMEMASTRPSATATQHTLVNPFIQERVGPGRTNVSRKLLDRMLAEDASLRQPQRIENAQGAWREDGRGQWNPAHILYYDNPVVEQEGKAIARAAKQMGVGFGSVERPPGWRDYLRGPLEAVSRNRRIKAEPNAFYVPRRGGEAVFDISRAIEKKGDLGNLILVDDPAGGGVFVKPVTWGESPYRTTGLGGLANDLPQLRSAPKARLLTDYAAGVE